jgi:uncharacterized C2H2 Zn-finger protein
MELKDESDNFEGLTDRECGEHRTTGPRAWCHDCTEWCYPEQPCRGCELPKLRTEIERLRRIMAHRLGGIVVEPHALVCPICGWDEKSKMEYVRHVVTEHGSLVA